jgi:hypothetical protein
MGLPARAVALLAAVGALLPLSGWLLVQGAGARSPGLIAGGALLGAVGLFGLLALVRLVVVLERRRIGR